MNDDLLFAYSVACAFFARVLQPGLDARLLRRCADDRLFQSWPLPGAEGEAAAGLAAVAETLAGLDEDTLARIEDDNTALFIGPDNPVPMWESVWTTEDRLLFADCTMQVQTIFAEFDFAIPDPERQPSDHLAFELAFMSALLARSCECDRAEARRHLRAAAAFLDDHLGRWAGDCLGAIADRAGTNFYRGVARLCAATLAGLKTRLSAAGVEEDGETPPS